MENHFSQFAKPVDFLLNPKLHVCTRSLCHNDYLKRDISMFSVQKLFPNNF
ncbi:hypothetical protein SAMN04488029_0591 [Reichenbachiella faecimaris]|uniref:Uncharacterized protein n=1 Tax=Reichenbachiella faecimaris TaxID=692418 RepID=A0A1W2G7C5_REIFA|nr:hypothetical protein SAMN04488029_0591 [Reichenbachiella faecimaris]